MNRTLWTELWARAQREELGLFLKFSNAPAARFNLSQTRPDHCRDYTICHTPDPDILLIVRPGVNLEEEQVAMIRADLG